MMSFHQTTLSIGGHGRNLPPARRPEADPLRQRQCIASVSSAYVAVDAEEVVGDGIGKPIGGSRDDLVDADRGVLEALRDVAVEAKPRSSLDGHVVPTTGRRTRRARRPSGRRGRHAR